MSSFILKGIVFLIFGLLILFSCVNSSSSEELNFDLQDIYPDTLELRAQFADCGEWGGHHEYFKIYQSSLDSEVEVLFIKDTVDCPDPDNFNRRKIIEVSRKLSIAKQKYVIDYLDLLLKKGFEKKMLGGNAGHLYYAKINNRNYSSPRLHIHFSSPNEWIVFEKFKVGILKKG